MSNKHPNESFRNNMNYYIVLDDELTVNDAGGTSNIIEMVPTSVQTCSVATSPIKFDDFTNKIANTNSLQDTTCIHPSTYSKAQQKQLNELMETTLDMNCKTVGNSGNVKVDNWTIPQKEKKEPHSDQTSRGTNDEHVKQIRSVMAVGASYQTIKAMDCSDLQSHEVDVASTQELEYYTLDEYGQCIAEEHQEKQQQQHGSLPPTRPVSGRRPPPSSQQYYHNMEEDSEYDNRDIHYPHNASRKSAASGRYEHKFGDEDGAVYDGGGGGDRASINRPSTGRVADPQQQHKHRHPYSQQQQYQQHSGWSKMQQSDKYDNNYSYYDEDEFLGQYGL